MNTKELSDFQLYSLILDKKLSDNIYAPVVDEYRKREFTFSEIEEMNMKYDQILKNKQHFGIKFIEKSAIILLPFIIPVQAVLACRHLKKGATNRWKQHWNLMALGYILWTFLIILISKYYLLK